MIILNSFHNVLRESLFQQFAWNYMKKTITINKNVTD